MYALLALISVLIAAVSFYMFYQVKDGGVLYLVLGIVFLILTAVFGVIFLSGRINKTDDIHITE